MDCLYVVDRHGWDSLRVSLRSLARFGRGAVTLASTGTERAWAMKRDMLSPCPTTRWSDIPVARAYPC